MKIFIDLIFRSVNWCQHKIILMNFSVNLQVYCNLRFCFTNKITPSSYDIILDVNSLRAFNIQIVGLPLRLFVFGKKIQLDDFFKKVSLIVIDEKYLTKSLCSITSEFNLLEFLYRKFNLQDENHLFKIFKNLIKKHNNQNFIPNHENDSEEDVLEEEINSNKFKTMLEKHDAT
jgi:hypothetical protein